VDFQAGGLLFHWQKMLGDSQAHSGNADFALFCFFGATHFATQTGRLKG
jgi:hypothetical protein